ncbi:hypothetical protein SprV_0501785500 [Sparganum proliferum]
MIAAPAHNLNGVKVEDVSHLRGMGCHLRLWVQPSHGQLMPVHSRLQPSAGFPNVAAPSAAALNFNTTDADPVIFIASFESVLLQTGAIDEAKDLLRHQVSSLLMSHLLRDERKALRELKADTELAILPVDKGRSTVILDKVDYRHRALMLLDDRESYKVSDAASRKSLVAKVNRIPA